MLVKHLSVLAQQLHKHFSFGDVDLRLPYTGVPGVHLWWYRCCMCTRDRVFSKMSLKDKIQCCTKAVCILGSNLDISVAACPPYIYFVS